LGVDAAFVTAELSASAAPLDACETVESRPLPALLSGSVTAEVEGDTAFVTAELPASVAPPTAPVAWESVASTLFGGPLEISDGAGALTVWDTVESTPLVIPLVVSEGGVGAGALVAFETVESTPLVAPLEVSGAVGAGAVAV
jgi:hypothetical protein